MKTRVMTTTKLVTRMAAILMLAVGIMTSAALAHDDGSDGFAHTGYYTGVETSKGTLEPATGIYYGNTIVMNSFGRRETYCLTVSVDYSTIQFVPGNYIVSGGTWSLVVFRDNAYAGTIYGNVSGGNVLVSTNLSDDPTQQMQINLEATGGMGVFNEKEIKDHTGSFTGITYLRSNHSEGNVQFD